MTTFSDRFKQRRDELGISQSSIAESLGIKPQSVHQWDTGMTTPRGHRVEKLAELLSTTAEWLLFGVKSENITTNIITDRDDRTSETIIEPPSLFSHSSLSSSSLGDNTPSQITFYNIPVYDVSFSAGDGAYSESDFIIDSFPVASRVLEQHNVAPGNAAIVYVRGDSMNTGIHNGDKVLLNTALKKPISDKIFAFAFDENLKVKRFTRQLDQTWLISSDNPDKSLYRDMTVSHENIEQLRIIGQVVTIVERSLL